MVPRGRRSERVEVERLRFVGGRREDRAGRGGRSYGHRASKQRGECCVEEEGKRLWERLRSSRPRGCR